MYKKFLDKFCRFLLKFQSKYSTPTVKDIILEKSWNLKLMPDSGIDDNGSLCVSVLY